MRRLETFGGLTLIDERGERPQPRRRVALFARLAVAGARGVSRDELLALFWPERDLDSARHSLDQLLYEARRDLGASPTRGTATLRLDSGVVASDVGEWSAAVERDDLPAAAALYRGPFLQGFHLSGSVEFERWTESARSQLAAQHRTVLETLATQASAAGRHAEAVAWWRRMASDDRFGARTALGLMRALVDAGDRGGALEFARLHERIMRVELECPPDPGVSAFVDTLRVEIRRQPIRRDPIPASTDSAPPRVAESTMEPALLDRDSNGSLTGPGAPHHRAFARMRWRTAFAGMVSLGLIVGYAATRREVHAGRSAIGSAAAPAATRSTTSRRARKPKHETTNIAAHDLFERGRDPRLLRSDSGQRAAIEILRHAIALDSNYSSAYAVLASRYTTFAWAATIPVEDRRLMLARAEAAARRAVALDDSLADAHGALGYVLGIAYDETASLAELERATALDPTSSETQETLAKAYEWLGRPADAVAAAKRAVSGDPMSASANAELGSALYFAHRYDEALAQLAKLSAVEPPLRRVPGYVAAVYGAKGRWSDAVAVLGPIAERAPHDRGLLGYALAQTGRRAEARRILMQMLRDESAGLAPAAGIAETYAGLGDDERAFVWLERSLDDHSLTADIMGPIFDELRADSRFERIRRRLGIDGPVAQVTTSMR